MSNKRQREKQRRWARTVYMKAWIEESIREAKDAGNHLTLCYCPICKQAGANGWQIGPSVNWAVTTESTSPVTITAQVSPDGKHWMNIDYADLCDAAIKQ